MDFRQAYDGMRQSYEHAMRSGDAVSVAGVYSEDAVILGAGMEGLIGRELIRGYQQQLLDAFTVDITVIPAEVQQFGDKGWGYGRWQAKVTSRQGGETVEVGGNFLNIVQLRADGGMEIIRHCWSSDQPLPLPLPQ